MNTLSSLPEESRCSPGSEGGEVFPVPGLSFCEPGLGTPPAQVLSWESGALWKALLGHLKALCLEKQVSKPGPDRLELEELS